MSTVWYMPPATDSFTSKTCHRSIARYTETSPTLNISSSGKGTSAKAYQVSRPLVTSLWNKYRLSLLNHGISHPPDILAWPMVAQACLTIAETMYNHVVEDAIKACPRLQPHQVRTLFKDFSLHRVNEAWTRALDMTERCTTSSRSGAQEHQPRHRTDWPRRGPIPTTCMTA